MNLTTYSAPYGAATNPMGLLLDPSALDTCHPCARLENELAEKNAQFAKIAADYRETNRKLTRITERLNRVTDSVDELPKTRGYSALQVGCLMAGTALATLTGVFWAYIDCCKLPR